MFVHEKSAKIHSPKSTARGVILCIRGVENKVSHTACSLCCLIKKRAYSKYAGLKSTPGNKFSQPRVFPQ